MILTPREKDKLLVNMAANVARRRLERGVVLNHPEARDVTLVPFGGARYTGWHWQTLDGAERCDAGYRG